MPTFRIDDPTSGTELDPRLRRSNAPPYMLDCYKLLMGAANLTQLADDRLVKCRLDYASFGRRKGQQSSHSLVKNLFGDGVSVEDGAALVEALKLQNVAFFRDLSVELSHCLFRNALGSYVEAYLHMYRVIEKLAISFPLIYISSLSEFRQAKQELSDLFREAGGELVFAGRFARMLADRSEYLQEYSITFRTKLGDVEDFRLLISELNAACPGFVPEDLDLDIGRFDVPFQKVPEFLISSRNRLFHYDNSGQRNIDIDKIHGAAELCRMMLAGGLQWIALAFLEIMRERAGRIGG